MAAGKGVENVQHSGSPPSFGARWIKVRPWRDTQSGQSVAIFSMHISVADCGDLLLFVVAVADD